MTELIRHQLFSMWLLLCGGMAAAMIYDVFRKLGGGTDSRAVQKVLQFIGLLLAGYSTSVFFYAGNYGEITVEGTVCLFAGMYLWRRVNFTEDGEKSDGEEGKQAEGV